jgi:hypothetical protein
MLLLCVLLCTETLLCQLEGYCKGKLCVVPVHIMKACGEVEVQLYKVEVSSETHALARG